MGKCHKEGKCGVGQLSEYRIVLVALVNRDQFSAHQRQISAFAHQLIIDSSPNGDDAGDSTEDNSER